MSTERVWRIETPKPRRPTGKTDRGLAASVALALAVKAVALAALYFAFFVPPAAPTPDRAATAIFGLSTRR